MATGQGVNFGFTSTGADDLARDFRKVGDNSAIAAKGARLCADALDKQRKAADVSAGATIALAKADKILADAEEELSGRAALADAALRGQGDAAKKAGRDSAGAAAGVSALAGTGGIPGGGLGALIAGGVALSPVIATLSVGLAGLGAAAVSTVGPILKAGTATAEAQKALASLDPAQRAAYDSLGLLKTQFGGFAKSLEPQVLDVFAGGLRVASGLMADVQPVAKATGDALGGFLGQIDAEFRSRTWQDFFGFMAKEAGPDMALVAGAILPLLDTLPKLLTDIQPIAVQFLQAAGGAARLADAAVTLNDKIQHLGTASGQSGGLLGRLADAGKKAVAQMLPGIPAAQALGKWLGVVGGNSDKAASGTGKAGDAFKGAAPHAMSYAQWVAQSAKATTALMDAQSAAVSTQLAYGNDILTSANDAQTFHDKLKASKGMIGLHTQAQRDSFGAANTYIGDLARQASSAVASGHGTDAAITAIKNGFPALDTVKSKNKQYWQEVKTLVGWLQQLELIKAINSAIHVSGTGQWSVTPGKIGLPGGTAGGPFARGGLVAATGLYVNRGTGPTADDVMIRASRGELIVPANMVRAGAVDHLRGAIPGFASGGVAGSYGPGPVGGLPAWGNAELAATQRAVARDTAASMVAAINQARALASPAYRPGGGVQQWRGLVLRALGMEGLSPTLADAVLYQMQTESGGNPRAINLTDINAQRGDPSRGLMQTIGSTFRAYHWPGTSWDIYDPLANIAAALNYARANYGPGLRNAYGGIGTGRGYALGGLIPGYASGGQVGTQGAAWLKAWQTRHGGGFGAAWGPVKLNQQIPEMAAAVKRARALSGAAGLSPGQHRFWSAAAADETRRLAVLGRELTTERAWRTQLGVNELGLDTQIRAAGNLPSLAGPVRGWKAQLGRDKATVAAISRMLGYSDAYIKAHPAPKPGPVLPGITHTYGGDVANTLGAVLASALGPFTGARAGALVMDTGGTLRPGYNGVWNGTRRAESLVPARGGGGIHLHLTVNAPIGSQQQLEDWYVKTANKLAQHGRLTQAVRAASR